MIIQLRCWFPLQIKNWAQNNRECRKWANVWMWTSVSWWSLICCLLSVCCVAVPRPFVSEHVSPWSTGPLHQSLHGHAPPTGWLGPTAAGAWARLQYFLALVQWEAALCGELRLLMISVVSQTSLHWLVYWNFLDDGPQSWRFIVLPIFYFRKMEDITLSEALFLQSFQSFFKLLSTHALSTDA